MTAKKLIGKLHRWLGFTAGLVVFISLTAAAIFVWEEELNAWYHRDKLFVKEVKEHRLPFDTLIAAAKQVSFNHAVSSVKIDRDPARAFVFLHVKKREKAGWTWASSIEDYSRIYVDQYTGKVLGVIDMRYDWIFCTRMLHQCLLLNYDVGHYIVGGATLIIFIMIITGIVLWWPKNKAALKQRLWFRWKHSTKWKRKNYDLHNIGGIYTFLFVLLFAITGLVWTFDWWTNGIYYLLGSKDPEKVFERPPKPIASNSTGRAAVDVIFEDVATRVPRWRNINMNIPADTGALKAVSSTIKYSSGSSGWDESDSYYYHPQTGELYFSTTHNQKTLGAKWRNSNYAIHVGSIYGWPTKVLACFIALFCASLPVTGFYIWWGRRKKKNRDVTSKTITAPQLLF
ncbi:MAG: PepSY-associated TM helix domain-containing protein [Agriterribacter sp.]